MTLTLKKTLWAALAAAVMLSAVPSYAADTTVQFKKGQTSATYQGKIKGDEYDRYFFTATQGQVLKLDLESANHAEMVLFGQDDYVVGDDYVLPKSGKYEVRVFHMRTFARRGAESTYRLTVDIQQSPTAAVKPLHTDDVVSKLFYSCDNQKILEVLYFNAAKANYAVIYQLNEMIPMVLTPSASGATYTTVDKRYGYKLYTKGDTAFLEEDGKIILDNCTGSETH